MKKYFYALPALLIAIVATSLQAAEKQEVYLRQYDCPSEQDALQCNANCKQYDMTSSYIASKESKTVEVSHYKSLKVFYKGKLENCNIVDEANWECNVASATNKTTLKMINGNYFASNVDSKSNAVRFFCAKMEN